MCLLLLPACPPPPPPRPSSAGAASAPPLQPRPPHGVLLPSLCRRCGAARHPQEGSLRQVLGLEARWPCGQSNWYVQRSAPCAVPSRASSITWRTWNEVGKRRQVETVPVIWKSSGKRENLLLCAVFAGNSPMLLNCRSSALLCVQSLMTACCTSHHQSH